MTNTVEFHSPPAMRFAAIRYLESLAIARTQAEDGYRRKNVTPDKNQLRELVAEIEMVNSKNGKAMLTLHSDGDLTRTNGELPGIWILNTTDFILKSPSPNGPGGFFIDKYTCDEHGKTMNGGNQRGAKIILEVIQP